MLNSQNNQYRSNYSRSTQMEVTPRTIIEIVLIQTLGKDTGTDRSGNSTYDRNQNVSYNGNRMF